MKIIILTTLVVLISSIDRPSELILKDPKDIGEEVRSPLPHTYLKEGSLPKSLDYRKLGYLTDDLNQHIPTCKKQLSLNVTCCL